MHISWFAGCWGRRRDCGWRVGHAPGRVGRRGAAHRGLLLEFDVDTAARGVFERLLGLVAQAGPPQTVNEEQSGCSERASLSAGRLTQKRTLYRAAAYRRVVICVSLRMAASAEAPSSLILLFPILRGMGGSTVRGQVRVSGSKHFEARRRT